jgi:GTP-binding protein EngB required for normal cell division
MLDFNKGIARFYNKELNGKIKELNTASIDDIMEFDDMPTKSYMGIVTEMNTQFADFYDKYSKVQAEIDKINIIISQAKQQCSYNIEEKAKKLLDDMLWERKKLIKERRVFYHRLKALDLIEESK